jgi:hypothetical protein
MTQKQINELIEDLNKHQSETKDTIKREIHELKMTTQIIKELKKLNFPKINELMKKWATEITEDFPKEEIQIDKKTHEKMLAISGHKRNANQNHT